MTVETVVAVGAESVGESALVGALTGDTPKSGSVGGTTVACERYGSGDLAVGHRHRRNRVLGGSHERAGAPLVPVVAVFDLPGEAAVLVVLSSIRKDWIALFAAEGVTASLTPIQVLTAVYLAGVLLPCLVTAMTVAREVSVRFVAGMLARQAVAVCVVAALLSHPGPLLGELLAIYGFIRTVVVTQAVIADPHGRSTGN